MISNSGPGVGPTALALHCRYSPLAFVYGMLTPQVLVNGHPVRAGWGRTVVPVPPGRHHVRVHVPYFLPRQVGRAELSVAVAFGQTVELEYRAPLVGFVGGSLGPPPQPYRGVGVLVATFGVSLAFALLVCVGGVVVMSQLTDQPVSHGSGVPRTPEPWSTSDEGSVWSPGPATPSGAAPASPTQAAPDRDDEPALKPGVPARTVVGRSYAATEETYTMAFSGWPFAFRTPGTWGCLGADVEVPGADAVLCRDEVNPFGPNPGRKPKPDQLARVVIRPCPGSCGAGQRQKLEREWFDPVTATPRRPDGDTAFLEGEDGNGLYTLSMSHFFSIDGAGRPDWQVGVVVKARPGDRADVQPIVNDILSQTS